jgi:FixJ family two-component response regulator
VSSRKPFVYVVDDDASMRQSLKRLIGARGFEVRAHESARAFLAESRIRHPSCLVLDVRLPDMDGLTLQEKLAEREAFLPIIFITGYGDIPMSVKAMKKGAVDFLPKPFTARSLTEAIGRALERDEEHEALEAANRKVQSLIDTLTPREQEVLPWIISGQLNKQIAGALGTTEKTIKVHRGHVMQKMGVSSVADLVRLTQKVGLKPAKKALD